MMVARMQGHKLQLMNERHWDPLPEKGGPYLNRNAGVAVKGFYHPLFLDHLQQ